MAAEAGWRDERCEKDGHNLAGTRFCTPPRDMDELQPPASPETCEGATYCNLGYSALDALGHGSADMRDEDPAELRRLVRALIGPRRVRYAGWVSFYLYNNRKCAGTKNWNGHCGWAYHKHQAYENGARKGEVLVTAYPASSGSNLPATRWIRRVGPLPDSYITARGKHRNFYRWGRMNGRFTGYEPDTEPSFHPGKWRLDEWVVYRPSDPRVSRSSFEIHGGRNADGSSRLWTTRTLGCIRLSIAGIRGLKSKWDNKTSNKKTARVYVRYK